MLSNRKRKRNNSKTNIIIIITEVKRNESKKIKPGPVDKFEEVLSTTGKKQ